MDPERRQHPRIRVRSQVEVRWRSWEQFRVAYTTDISRGGMRLEISRDHVPETAASGAPLTVRLILPSADAVEFEAEVRHVSQSKPNELGFYWVGIQFREMGDRLQLIEELLREHGFPPLGGRARH